jgi:hypothetical protein
MEEELDEIEEGRSVGQKPFMSSTANFRWI